MHTLSSASRTCMASASAVECTATVGMPSSLQARSTRSAISPRLAMRIFSNIRRSAGERRIANGEEGTRTAAVPIRYSLFATRRSLDDHQRLAELDGLTVLEQELRHGAGGRRRNLVAPLHPLDEQQRGADLDPRADVDERFCPGLGRPIGRADHGREHDARML